VCEQGEGVRGTKEAHARSVLCSLNASSLMRNRASD
jgi:hypothetical protein